MIESLIQKNSLAILRCKAFCFLCRGDRIGYLVGRAHCVTPFRSISALYKNPASYMRDFACFSLSGRQDWLLRGQSPLRDAFPGRPLGEVTTFNKQNPPASRRFCIERKSLVQARSFLSIQKSRILHAGFCLFQFVGETGFEPATFWSQTRRANRAALHPECLMAQR